ncbi:phosphopantetheine-binding protein [Rhodoferax sp.]|uniref:phosphopantetheine-binding protein n=1 Tax=Rhodoferax sp. TaxID=50421 RepID=UPI0025F57599|nr:phosphopantetheine-binding protein [Rhodoferax sp.]
MTEKEMHALNIVRSSLERYTDSPAEAIGMETLLADIQVDSLTTAELLFELEDWLETTIPETPSLPQSVSDLVSMLEPYLNEDGSKKTL